MRKDITIEKILEGGEKDKGIFKNRNYYLKYVKLGKEKYNKDIRYENIMDKLVKTDSIKLEKILKTIEDILDE